MRIKIGGIYHTVEYPKGLKGDENQLLDGRLRHSMSVILVDRDVSPQASVQCILHEVIHEMLIQLGRGDFGERFVDPLAFSLLQVIRDNPALITMIQKLK